MMIHLYQVFNVPDSISPNQTIYTLWRWKENFGNFKIRLRIFLTCNHITWFSICISLQIIKNRYFLHIFRNPNSIIELLSIHSSWKHKTCKEVVVLMQKDLILFSGFINAIVQKTLEDRTRKTFRRNLTVRVTGQKWRYH